MHMVIYLDLVELCVAVAPLGRNPPCCLEAGGGNCTTGALSYIQQMALSYTTFKQMDSLELHQRMIVASSLYLYRHGVYVYFY